MPTPPAIAVLCTSTLAGLGLKALLGKIVPEAEVELFASFDAFIDAEPDRFVHFFIASRHFLSHPSFFRQRRTRTIVLTGADADPACAGMHCLDPSAPEQQLVCDLMRLRRGSGRPDHALPPASAAAAPLTPREREVLALVARGMQNKQIAQRLGIGLTTALSHRRNLTEKLGIRSVAGLTIYALSAGLIDADEA